MITLGVIGIGNMGEALLRGALRSDIIAAEQIIIFDTNIEKAARIGEETGVSVANSLGQLLQKADILLLAIKPDVCARVFDAHRDAFSDKALLSIAAGWSAERLRSYLPDDTRVLRIMPNTPALIGAGMSVFEDGDTLHAAEKTFAIKLFSSIGKVETVAARLMDAVTSISGSGPAYAYMFIETLADGGVRAGLPRDLAYRLAVQTVTGAAKMVEETGRHPGELKDMVCSPGGTTIEAVVALEQHGLRDAVLAAVEACHKRAKELSNDI